MKPLYNKLSKNEQNYFNSEDIKLLQKLKGIAKNLKLLALPMGSYYKIIQTDASILGWTGILIQKTNIDSPREKEEITMYTCRKFIKPKSRKSST